MNLASRIESAAGPAETFVSHSVCEHLDKSWFADAGQFELKGLESSQSLYRLVVEHSQIGKS